MTGFLLGALVAFAMGTAVECYLLLGLAQRLLTYAEQLLVVGKKLLADMPSKSADRTEAAVDQVLVQPWFPRLRLLADLRDLAHQLAARGGVGPDTTVKDALTAEAADNTDADERPTDTLPPVDDATAPMKRVDVAGGLRVRSESSTTPEQHTEPQPDDVDRELARWGLRTADGALPPAAQPGGE